MKLEISPKMLLKNLSYSDMQELVTMFILDRDTREVELFKQDFLGSIEKSVSERPNYDMVYSNKFVEYMITLFETDRMVLGEVGYLNILKKAKMIDNGVITPLFTEVMNETKSMYGYSFSYIQDQVWYAIYPDKR